MYKVLDFFFCSHGCAGAPVDKLLFLTSRAQWKTQESAVLVSSEACTLEFWCLYGANRPMGMYLNTKCYYASRRIAHGSNNLLLFWLTSEIYCIDSVLTFNFNWNKFPHHSNQVFSSPICFFYF